MDEGLVATASSIVDRGLRLGLDEVAVSLTREVSRQVRFSNSAITVTKTWDSVTADILASKDGRIATYTTANVSEEAIKRGLRRLRGLLAVIKPHESYAPLPEGPFSYEPVRGLFDDRVPRLREECVGYVEDAISSALESGAREVSGTLFVGWSSEVLETSRGARACERRSSIHITVRGSADTKEGKVYGMGVSCGRALGQFDPGRAGADAGTYARMSTELVKAEEGRYDTVFGRPGIGNLLNFLSLMTSAFYVDSGLSFLVGKIGEGVASERVTLRDDPRMAGGLGSRSFDREGRPTRPTVLIDGGVLRTYLHNRLTAKKFKAEPTANAGWIAPRPWNVCLSAGDLTDEELLSEVRDGLFINNVTYLRFHNYRTGDFSAIVRDGVFRVRNGEIVGAVRGLRLSDNMGRMMEAVAGLSDRREQVFHWWCEAGIPATTPMMLVRGCRFTLPTA
ncbi:TPA: TldD/PmbA family protein [Candidatus Bathyarchaeota archaeon]|nr:TldD/PmbA family protein [Candidatus Bathyarchaeota archaeon]